MATERAWSHDDHAHRGGKVGILGREEAVERGAGRESRGIVTAEVVEGAIDVGTAIKHGDIGAAADNDFAADGIDLDGAEREVGQTAVACNTLHLDRSQRLAIEGIGGIACGIELGLMA